MAALLDILHARLARVRRKEDLARALQGLLLALLAWLCLGLAALAAEAALFTSPAVRITMLWAVAGAGALVLGWRSGPSVLRLLGLLLPEPDEATARRVGAAFPAVRDRLLNAFQLARLRATEGAGHPYSPGLLDAALEDLRGDLEPLDFTTAVSYAGSRRAARFLGVAAGILLLVFLAGPSAFFGSAYRLWHAGELFAAPAPFRLLVEPGDREVVKGENVRISVRVEGSAPEQVMLAGRPAGQSTDEEYPMTPAPDGGFRFDFTALKSSTRYAVHAGDVRSREYLLTVIDRPLVRLLRLALQPPGYTGLPAQHLEDNVGDVTALKGTHVAVALSSNKELASARVDFSDGATLPLTVTGSNAAGTLQLLKDRTYHITLVDRDSIGNADPIEYSLKTLPDAYPAVSILSPAANLDVTDNTTIPLLIRITDDYGFSRLRLAYKLVQSRYEKPAREFAYLAVPIPAGTGTEGTVPFNWPLAPLHLAPEDVVSYYVEVFDNDVVSGPKSALSEVYTLRLPSMDEVFADVDKAHDVSQKSLEESLNSAREARKDMEELLQETKKNQQKLDWQDQKKAEQLSKRYEDLQKKLADVQQTVDTMVQEMQKNRVLSPETLEKYQELQQLMEQMNSPEFAEALKQLQQAMQQMSPEAMRQALEKFSFSEENFRKGIERTMSLLKRIQIEQKVDQAVRRAEEMERQQQDLREQTGRMDPKDRAKADELTKQQQELQRQAEAMKKDLADLQKKMEEFPGEMPLPEMEKVNKDLAESKLDEQLGEIARQLSDGQQSQAMQGQQRARQQMGQVQQQLRAMKQSLQQNQQRQVMNEMRRDLNDLLELSQREEALKNESRALEQNSPAFRRNAEQQMQVMRDLNRLADRMSSLSQKTFAVTPDMGKSLGDAMRSMAEAMKSLEQRAGGGASESQQQAMGSLNESAQLMQNSMDAMQQGGGQGMGMAGFLQRMKQLSGMQQGINQGTQQAQGMSQEQAAAMARLAGEQGMVRKSLEQLQREAAASGDLQKMLGDLSSIARDMREVQTDMAQGNVNPETTRKQDRILSRLLDAQRSTRERDFEKRRTSESGKDILRPSPGPIDLTSQEGRNRLRLDLLKALEQGYARDYEDLIKKYFDALEQQPR